MTTTTKKVYAVMLKDHVTDELGALSKVCIREGALGSHIYAKSVEPKGPYFHMIIEVKSVTGDSGVEFELQLPHSSVKAVLCAPDVKHLGFT